MSRAVRTLSRFSLSLTSILLFLTVDRLCVERMENKLDNLFVLLAEHGHSKLAAKHRGARKFERAAC
jgi:hypothetical protein